MTTQLPQHLAELGDVLERAAAADLAAPGARRGRRRYSRRALVALAAVVVAAPAAALAASALLTTPAQVAAGLPAANRWLEGTDPTCTVVTANVEYHCVLASPPQTALASQGTSGSAPVAGASSHTAIPFQAVSTSRHGIIRIKLRDGTSCTARAPAKLTLVHAKLTCIRHGARVTLAPAQAWSIAHMPAAAGATSPTGATATGDGGASSPVNDWTGTVEPTVDATKHVNGGCRAQNAAGTDWECYLGEAAVAQNIISQGFLGQYAPVPGVG